MVIEIWSDFVCPFCYIGKRNLEKALESFKEKEEVELVYRSFELDPEFKKQEGVSLHEIIAKKYGIPTEQAKASNDNLIEYAKSVGLDYNFEDIIPANTLDAHRLSHYAKTKGKMYELEERIMRAYFIESRDISDHEVLTELAGNVGLDKAEVSEMLKDGSFEEVVRMEEEIAHKSGITGVPFFIIDDKFTIYGAQPPEAFQEAFNKIGTNS